MPGLTNYALYMSAIRLMGILFTVGTFFITSGSITVSIRVNDISLTGACCKENQCYNWACQSMPSIDSINHVQNKRITFLKEDSDSGISPGQYKQGSLPQIPSKCNGRGTGLTNMRNVKGISGRSSSFLINMH